MEEKWPKGDLRLKFLAYLLKAFHQVKHGIIWDDNNDEVHKNNTLPNTFFYKDALSIYGKNFKMGTTGWSVDDLMDTERLEHPLLMQLFDADNTNFKDLLPKLDDNFPILGAVLATVEKFMDHLHEKLKSVNGTNRLLNEVGGKNLHMYSTTDIIPEGLPTIPPYRKSDWVNIMAVSRFLE
jgi:hypothetical protein